MAIAEQHSVTLAAGLACDGANRQAIVVSSDIAEYARGSSGESTQGAGAVALLLEARQLGVHRGDDGLDGGGDLVVVQYDVNFDFGQEIHDIFGSTVEFRVAL